MPQAFLPSMKQRCSTIPPRNFKSSLLLVAYKKFFKTQVMCLIVLTPSASNLSICRGLLVFDQRVFSNLVVQSTSYSKLKEVTFLRLLENYKSLFGLKSGETLPKLLTLQSEKRSYSHAKKNCTFLSRFSRHLRKYLKLPIYENIVYLLVLLPYIYCQTLLKFSFSSKTNKIWAKL